MKDIRAKSAHPLGRKKTAKSAKSLIFKSKADISTGDGNSQILHSSFGGTSTKYNRELAYKERKERLKTFTNKKLNKRYQKKNRELLESIYTKNNINRDVFTNKKKFQEDLEIKQKQIEETIAEELERKNEEMENNLKKTRNDIILSIKESKEKVKNRYKAKFPNIPIQVQELRELEHKQKYMKSPPLFEEKEKQFEENEKKRMKEVRDELHATRNQPIDFVVSFY